MGEPAQAASTPFVGDKEGGTNALGNNDVDTLRRAVVFASLYEEDRAYALELCLNLSSHPNPGVRGNAILGFGHIARIDRVLDRDTIQPII